MIKIIWVQVLRIKNTSESDPCSYEVHVTNYKVQLQIKPPPWSIGLALECQLNFYLTCFQQGFIGEVMDSNPVGASESFLCFLCNWLIYFVTVRITFTRSSSNDSDNDNDNNNNNNNNINNGLFNRSIEMPLPS